MSNDVQQEVQQDLQNALKASKELIESMREYSKNLASDLDEVMGPSVSSFHPLTARNFFFFFFLFLQAKEQISLLKERLHENTKNPLDEKAEKKRQLAQWLKEAQEQKLQEMNRALIEMENRQLKFELDEVKKSTTPSKKKSSVSSAAHGGFSLSSIVAVGLICAVLGFAGGKMTQEK